MTRLDTGEEDAAAAPHLSWSWPVINIWKKTSFFYTYLNRGWIPNPFLDIHFLQVLTKKILAAPGQNKESFWILKGHHRRSGSAGEGLSCTFSNKNCYWKMLFFIWKVFRLVSSFVVKKWNQSETRGSPICLFFAHIQHLCIDWKLSKRYKASCARLMLNSIHYFATLKKIKISVREMNAFSSPFHYWKSHSFRLTRGLANWCFMTHDVIWWLNASIHPKESNWR